MGVSEKKICNPFAILCTSDPYMKSHKKYDFLILNQMAGSGNIFHLETWKELFLASILENHIFYVISYKDPMYTK
jgi:hypothetical protein